jgi:hypothetical protein
LARLKTDSDAAREEKFEWFFVLQAFKDHLVWAYALLFHGFAFVLYSLSLFLVWSIIIGYPHGLPSFLADDYCGPWIFKLAGTIVGNKVIHNFSTDIFFRMTVPPNTLASLSIWSTVWLSSRYNARAPFIIGAAFVAIIGTYFLLH